MCPYFTKPSSQLPSSPYVIESWGAYGFYIGSEGGPDIAFYRGEAAQDTMLTHWHQHPGPDAAVENALYNQWPQASEGFVINTPYISVFSPVKELSVVIVSLCYAERSTTFSRANAYIINYTRRAQWYTQTVNLR